MNILFFQIMLIDENCIDPDSHRGEHSCWIDIREERVEMTGHGKFLVVARFGPTGPTPVAAK